MDRLQRANKKVSIIRKYLFGKEGEPLKTLKECDEKIAFYYRAYGATYLEACKSLNIKVNLLGGH